MGHYPIWRPLAKISLAQTAWEDLRFPAIGINPPGAASDPTRDTSDGRLVFSASAENIIAIQVQMPHHWLQGGTLYPHVHWSPTSTHTGNVLWRLQYKVANINAAFPGSFTPIDILQAGSGTADMHQMASFPTISMTGKTISCMLLMLVSRVGNDGTDTYTGTAKLNEFDIHYQVDGFGSYQVSAK
jgi:hypothetical protein